MRIGLGSVGLYRQQAGSSGAIDQVFDRRRRPFGPATRCTLVKPFQLAGDLAQREFRVGGMNPCYQRHESVFREARRRFFQQGDIRHAFGHHPFHGAAKTLRRPVESALLQDTRDVVPGVVGTHAPHGRKPLIGRRLNAIAVGCLLGGGHTRQCIRAAFANTGVARLLSLCLCGTDSRLRSLGNECAFELGDGAEDLKGKHTLRRRRVDRISQRSKMRAFGRQIVDYLEQMTDGTRQAIEPDHDKGVACDDLPDEFCKSRSAAGGAGSVFLNNRSTAGGTQLDLLRLRGLFVRRDTRVTD